MHVIKEYRYCSISDVSATPAVCEFKGTRRRIARRHKKCATKRVHLLPTGYRKRLRQSGALRIHDIHTCHERHILVKHKTHLRLSAVGGRHCAANFLNRELRHIERSSHNEQGLFPNHKPATQQTCQNQSNAQNSALEVACPLAGLVRALHFDEQHC